MPPLFPTLSTAALIAAGGGGGALARHLLGMAIISAGAPSFAATFLVNVLGSWALGALYAATEDPQVRLFIGTGALGGFTTFSTFALDANGLSWPLASLYVVATVALGLAAFHLGRG
jgi:fluoride exporter